MNKDIGQKIQNALSENNIKVSFVEDIKKIPKQIEKCLISIKQKAPKQIFTSNEQFLNLKPTRKSVISFVDVQKMTNQKLMKVEGSIITLTKAFACILENGSIVINSQENISWLSYYCDYNFVLIDKETVFKNSTDFWKYFKIQQESIFPNALHFISSPSQTGDIEQTLQLGAHGAIEVFALII